MGLFNFSLGNDINTTVSTVILNGPAGNNTYLWSTGETSQNISVTTSGTYFLTATNEFGCEFTDTIVVNFTTGISEIDETMEISIYPNPSNEIVSFESKKGNIDQIEIYDLNGKLILNPTFSPAEKITLDVKNISNGTYLVKIISDNYTVRKKWVVVR